jgi:dihydrodipicolinate synthase/N-acetylneuraminate lyase
MTPPAPRYRHCMLATCCVPWREDHSFDESTFRRQTQHLLAGGLRDLYIFGTAGEGYAVTDSQFNAVTRAFLDETALDGVQTMIGLISLSLPVIIERIERARAMGATRFQISLPSWGTLTDPELDAFFSETCGRFPECEFLHYNLPRAGRLLNPGDYARLAERHPNLVATKNSTRDVNRLRGLLHEAPKLRHFVTEPGFAAATAIGPCGLLVSVAGSNLALAHEFFNAALRQDHAALASLSAEAESLVTDLLALVDGRAHMDGAFDKLFIRLNLPGFPLRLLPPYSSLTDSALEHFARLLAEKYPRWSPAGSLPASPRVHGAP